MRPLLEEATRDLELDMAQIKATLTDLQKDLARMHRWMSTMVAQVSSLGGVYDQKASVTARQAAPHDK